MGFNNTRIGFPPPMIRLCGLWKSIDKNGQNILAGTLGNSKIFVFPNDRKTDDSQPDFFLTLGQRIFPDDWKKSNGNNKLIIEFRHTRDDEIIKNETAK